jgi:hypothetical protein
MTEHDFEVQDRQKSDLPNFLKKQQKQEPRRLDHNQTFNRTIHVDLIDIQTDTDKSPGKTILSITDDSRTFSKSAVLSDSGIDSTVSAIWNYWCQPFGFPETIFFKQGKVQTSKLESRINELIPLKRKISCQSRKYIFNLEIEQQWQQNQNEISAEEFVHNLNFLCNLQNPARTTSSDNNQGRFDGNCQDLTDVKDFTGPEDDLEEEYEELPPIDDQQLCHLSKRKHVSLCRHKLQGCAHGQSRRWRQATDLQPRLSELEEEDTDHEWAQLRQLEEFIEKQKQELLKHGVKESDDEDKGWDEHQEPEGNLVKEDDNLDDGDMTYITAILESFSRPKSNSEPTSAYNYVKFTPEVAPTQAPARPMTPPESNQKFNQTFNKKSTINYSEAEIFSCFTTIWEEGTTELADYYSDKEEDDSLDNKDTQSEKDTWNELDLEELGEISDKEDSWSKAEPDEFETPNEVDYEEPGDKTTSTGISSLSVETAQAFSAWQPYIPPKHAFQSLSAQSWWSDSSQQASLSQEPTLTQISSIRGPDSTIKPSPAPMTMLQTKQTMRSPPQGWKPSRPAMKPYMRIWSKPWPESSKMYKGTKSSLNESPDHQGQSK